MYKWINFFNQSTYDRGTEGHCLADRLPFLIQSHDGSEAYHSAYDMVDEFLKLEEDTGEVTSDGKKIYRYLNQTKEGLERGLKKSISKYEGPHRPAMGYVWLDFDSEDGKQAQIDAASCFAWLNHPDVLIFYSGSKGFHLGIPAELFPISPSPKYCLELRALAYALKKQFPSLDVAIFNPQRKFRVPGSKHPKTGLYKTQLDASALTFPIEEIKKAAASRSAWRCPVQPNVPRGTLPQLVELAAQCVEQAKASIPLDEWRKYRQPEGSAALSQCLFLKSCAESPAEVTEPQWYAMASIVGRFKDGRAKFHALSKGHPGYNVHSADEKLEQALQSAGPRTCQAIGAIWSGCQGCPHFEKIKSPVVIMEKEMIPTEATGFYDLYREEKSGAIKRTPNYNDLLKAFDRDSPYKSIADMKCVYAFNGTHYEEKTPIEIKGFAEEKFEPKPQEKYRQEFVHKLFANHITRRAFFFKGTDDRINFANGVLEIGAARLIPHSPDYGFRHVLPYPYDQKATCPTFDWWIKDVMLGDAQLIAILQEFMGYVIRGGDYIYHKALWLSGSGRNGKSTFLRVLKALIGAGNYSTLSIKQIINDKFAAADLDEKIANFSEETSPEELSDSGPFKNLTGDGEINAQKKYGHPYTFANKAKMIMTYNEVPIFKDLSSGMLSRPLIVPFRKDMTDESTQDKKLKSKLLAELPGIFNFALEGWQRLDKQEAFTYSPLSELSMREIESASCSATRWVEEAIEFRIADTGATFEARTLYNEYSNWIGSAGGKPLGEMKFLKRINKHPDIRSRVRRTEKGMEYFGMKLDGKLNKSRPH